MDKLNSFKNIQCIWMTSSVVSYKLCDRKFDCDNCLFDKAMRNTFHSTNEEDLLEIKTEKLSIIQNIISKIGNSDFKSNYFYLNNNLIAKNLFDDTYYIGLSPIAVNLLDGSSLIESSSENKNIFKGDKIAFVKGKWGEVNITSPINFKWLGKLMNFQEQSVNEKWLGLVEIPKAEVESASVSISNYHREIINITKELDSYIFEYPDVGDTMLDGWFEIRFLYQSIGKDKYMEILHGIFNTSFCVKKL